MSDSSLLSYLFFPCSVISNSFNPTDYNHQTPLSMGFSRQEYWSGFPFPPLGDLPDPGIKPTSPAFPTWQADSLPLGHQGKRSLGVCSNSCPLSHWCYLTISSSAAPFSFCLQSFPASESFLIRWLFTSGGRSIVASASATVLPMNIQDWSPLELTIDWQYNLNILFYVMIRVSLKTYRFSGTSAMICFVFNVKKRETRNVGRVGMQKSHILRISGFTYFQRYSCIKTYCKKKSYNNNNICNFLLLLFIQHILIKII